MKKIIKEQAIAMADEVKYLSMNEIKALPNMLGAIAPSQVNVYGYYAYHNSTSDKNICIIERV